LFFVAMFCVPHVSSMMNYATQAAEKEFPFAVYIELGDSTDMPCTGVVVGAYWVLTQANCIAQVGTPEEVKVYGGGISNIAIARNGPAVQTRDVLGVYYCPDWYAGALVEDPDQHTFYASFIPNHNWALLGLADALDVTPLGIIAFPVVYQTTGFMDSSMMFGYGYEADNSDYSTKPSGFLRTNSYGSIYSASECLSTWDNIDGNFHWCYSNSGGNPCWGDAIVLTKYMDVWWVDGVLNQYNPTAGYDSFSQTDKYTYCGSGNLNVYTRLDIDLDYITMVMNGGLFNGGDGGDGGPVSEPQGSQPQGSQPQSEPQAAEPQSAPQAAEPQSAPQGAEPQSAPQAAEPQSAPQGASPEGPGF